jgi:hypothetical protein
MTDTIISQSIYFSSWITLYIQKDIWSRQREASSKESNLNTVLLKSTYNVDEVTTYVLGKQCVCELMEFLQQWVSK